MEVVIVPTGTANVASVLAAFRRLGAAPALARNGDDVVRAERVVLPGVGSFGASMARLRQQGMAEAMAQRLLDARPTIGFCVGLQLMFTSSDESPGVSGLGVLDGHVGRFDGGVRVPQFGWNRVEPAATMRLVRPGYAYFANSYRVTDAPGCAVAHADHGGPFVAALEYGDVLGCQFHPELSGAWGQALLGRWLEGGRC